MFQPRILIHVGYPKAGSSTLQESIFPNHVDVNYLSGPPLAARLGVDAQRAFDLYKAIIGEIPRNIEKTCRIFEEFYRPLLSETALNVFSTEYFIQNNRPPRDVAEDLHAVVGPAAILIVVREQTELLRSLYDMNPFLETDPTRRYRPFNLWLTAMLQTANDTLAGRLAYREVAESFADVFGAEAIHVLGFERLFADPAAAAPFCEKIGIDPDRFAELASATRGSEASLHGYKKFTRRVLGSRTASDLLPGPVLEVGKFVLRSTVPAKKTILSPHERRRIETFYAGNRISDLHGVGFGTVLT